MLYMKSFLLFLSVFLLNFNFNVAFSLGNLTSPADDGLNGHFTDGSPNDVFKIGKNVIDCHINNVTAEVTTCENGLFNVLINFEHEATSDSFRINGNGVMYGHFAYADLPVLLEGLAANCETNYEFGIRDLEHEDCHSATGLGVVCCEGACEISNLVLATSDCAENNHHSLTIDFDVENPGNAYFDVWVNSVFRGNFLITALPLTLTMENTTQAYDHVLVCINDVDNCCIDGNIANPCYIVENCDISNVTAEVTTCENGLFNVLINFEHEATSDSFRINGNGVMYGHFAYADLPVLLEGLAANCETNYEFGIRDLEHEDCHSATGLGVVCCEGACEISNLVLATSDCAENNHHSLTIDFDVENPGNAYFDVWVNSVFRGNFLITALPLTLTMENTTQAYDHVLVCINDVDNCCIDGNIANPCYIVENCDISNVTAEVTTCENGLFNVLINFEHEATSDSFRINGNGVMYGHFAYADLPVLLEGLAANCETNYEFGIRDLEHEDCHSATGLGVVCCEGDCSITDLSLSASECNSDEDFLLTIDFNYDNPGNDLFELWFNGWYIGNFNLNTLPLTLAFENSGFQADTIIVCINDQEECCAVGIVNNPCNPSDICNIFELDANVMTCENDLFNVEIDFSHNHTSESFMIRGNDKNYGTYTYSNLPVLLEGLNADCETSYQFDIIDLGDESCRKSTELGKVCCSTTDITDPSSPAGNYYYSSESNRMNLDFKENLYDEVIVTFYNLLGQKVDQVKLQQVSGAKYLEVLSDDYIQFGKIDLFRKGKLAGSETVKIMKLR